MTPRAASDKLGAISALTSLLLQMALVLGAILAIGGHRVGAWVMLAAVIGSCRATWP